MQCKICYEPQKQLLSLAACVHRFCQSCSLRHIDEKANRFTRIECPDPSCKKPLNKNSQLYSMLPTNVKEKISKHDDYLYLQDHPSIKSCAVANCTGRIDLRYARIQCNKCRNPHCPRCIKVFHDGPCLVDEFDIQMKNMNFQKCPKCMAWVEKKEGCQYIDCKCGTAFCYRCGVEFASDPCRKGHLFQKEFQIKLELAKLKYKLPQNKCLYIFLPIKLPLQVIGFILFSVFFSVVCWLGYIIIIAFLIAFSPLIMMVIICQIECPGRLLALLFAPLLIALMVLMIVVGSLLYPVLRNTYHHGIYDGLDTFVFNAAVCYLRVVNLIFS